MNAKFAMVFPGQGSQSVGMLAELAASYPVLQETYRCASDVLGYDLWQRVCDGPDQELNRTTVTQPAMLAAGVGVWRIWQACAGANPVVMAGHSLGEYTALVCAGALDFAAAIGLVAKRGAYMQEAVPEGVGAMAAILGLRDEQVRELCAKVADGDIVSAVNFNAPGQVVVAGHADAVQRAMLEARQQGAKRAVLIAVSAPSHCALMQPAATRLEQDLRNIEFKQALIPVVNNVDVAVCDTADGVRDSLIRQLYQPVRWTEVIRKIAGEGVGVLLECGPGKVLSALNKRIALEMTALPIYDTESLQQALDGSRSSSEA